MAEGTARITVQPFALSARILRRITRRLAPETRGLARDSFTLMLASGVATAGQIAQIALITHTLGLREYGIFATVVAFVAIVNRFFDVQVGDAMISQAAALV